MILRLTDTERNIIVAVANGQTNTTIARDHRIHQTTAGRHIRKICDRLGARDRAHLVGLAFAARIITAADVTLPTASSS